MVKVEILKEKNIKEVWIKGHALYDDYGKDIVCASISSIVITTVNAILRIDKDALLTEEKPFHIIVKKENEIIENLLSNMIDLLKELEKDYPKNIKFL